MQDIDFDELDRAVSSVLGTTRKQETPQPAVATTPVAAPLPSAIPAPAPSEAPVPRPVMSSAPRPATGRFMDVVHPSSDMRGGASSSVTQPSTAYTPEVVRPTTPVAQPSFDLERVAEPTPIPEVSLAPVMELAYEEDSSTPLESPFLSNAKVEKRPLGAFSAETAPEIPSIPVYDENLDVAEEVLISEIESSDTNPELEIDTIAPVVAIEESAPSVEPEVAIPTEEAVQPLPAQETPAVTEFNRPIQSTVTSISQQYTEQSSSNQESGAIFDTESYHQPLAHPQKKKSGVFVILWIVGLIVLGAGMGAALYFFVLQGM